MNFTLEEASVSRTRRRASSSRRFARYVQGQIVSRVKLMVESYISAGSMVGRCLREYEVVCGRGLEPRLGTDDQPMRGDFARQ